MTFEEAAALRTFKNYCQCGGYAYDMNGRDPANPHMDWCPQKDEYREWWDALRSKPSNKVPLGGGGGEMKYIAGVNGALP